MFITGIKKIFKSVPIAASVITGAVFLLPVENALAVANLSLSTSHEPADAARAAGIMDYSGTWNGSREVSNDDPAGNPAFLFPSPDGGDDFVLKIDNLNTGVADTAFDIDISVTVPDGIRLPRDPMVVNAEAISGTCTDFTFNAVHASPTLINFNFSPNTNIDPGCEYDFHLGLTTDTATPFGPAGAQSVIFNVTYNQIDNNNPAPPQSNTQNVTVNPVVINDLQIIKTANTAVASNGQPVSFNVLIRNLGSSGMFDVTITDLITANLVGLGFSPAPTFPDTSVGNQYTLKYLAVNEVVNLTVNTTAFVDPTDTNCPVMNNIAQGIERTGIPAGDSALVDFNLSDSLQLTHNLTTSFCSLCGIGTVRLTAENVGGIGLRDIVLYEDLGNSIVTDSGLTFVPGTVRLSVDGGPFNPIADPLIDPAEPGNLQRFYWTYDSASTAYVPQLELLNSPFRIPVISPVRLEFEFQVQRIPGLSEEALISVNRNIQPNAEYELTCNSLPQTSSGALVQLPLRNPIPVVTKLAINTDAGMGTGDYAPLVSGHVEDSIIWRVEVQNTGVGSPPIEDLLIDDEIIGGNFDINWICNSQGAANAATAVNGSGPTPAGCIAVGGAATVGTSIQNLDIDDTTLGVSGFGNPNNDETTTFFDVPASPGSAFFYYVGRILQSCTLNSTNTVDIEWGCEADGDNVPPGGITTPNTNISSIGTFNAEVAPGGLLVQQAVTGIDPNQPVGSVGLVTIQITNNTGSTVRDIVVQDVLPAGQYVVDSSFTPTALVTPAFGANYDGMIDIIDSDIDVVLANLLNNIAPTFTLRSSTQRSVNTLPGDDRNLLRNGDVLTIQFRIVLRESSRYDLSADINIAPEVQGDTTDPDSDFTIPNQVIVDYSNICNPVNPAQVIDNQNFPVDVEDLDVDISDALFILTNDTNIPLTLNVLLTNNGGHDADNHTTYVTFGQAMTVQTIPAGCGFTTVANPPPHPIWNIPEILPATASVYACDRGVLAPGVTEAFAFTVIKNTVGAPVDDLTFRADVVGEIYLTDGVTPLVLPTPASIANTTPNQQLANNYSLDAVRSRVLGFNLTHTAWYCTESGTAEPVAPTQSLDLLGITLPAELNTQIGEDCHNFIEAGGWFGFDTPGFDIIAISDITIRAGMEGVPAGNGSDGLGFIPFDQGSGIAYDFNTTTPGPTTAGILLNGPTGGAGTIPLVQTPINWSFNTAPLAPVTEADLFFRVNYKNRLLNDDVDLVYPPYAPLPNPDPTALAGRSQNVHGRISSNIAGASFRALFQDAVTGDTFDRIIDETTGVPGFPNQADRQIDLTDVEPNIIVVKEVCNESLSIQLGNGSGENCNGGAFSASITAADGDAGDSNDNYVYRITLTNEATATSPEGGASIARTSAYNVEVSDTLDSSDLMGIDPITDPVTPFNNDGLDNDGDGAADGADGDGEFLSLTENVANGLAPATFVISHQHSNALDEILPGASVSFYYRIDPDQNVAPQQPLDNTVSTTYDSLVGPTGSQNEPSFVNTFPPANNSGGARKYTAVEAVTSIQIIPLQTEPKAIIETANATALGGATQAVVVGEEILYELTAQIPIAELKNFRIRDELPPGLRCVNAQVIDLNALPYSNAGFEQGGAPNVGTFTSTCDPTGVSNVIEWSFGDQELTTGVPGTLFTFTARFTARVENLSTINETPACVITNGGTDSGTPAVCSGAPSVAILSYDETFSSGTGALTNQTLVYGAVNVEVQEPEIIVTKSFAVANADATDILTVTVTVENPANTSPPLLNPPAYNVEILDDLSGTNTTYLGFDPEPASPNAPDDDGVDPLRPVFSWDRITNPDDFTISDGEILTFTYRVQVNPGIQPEEIIFNEIEAKWTSLPGTDIAVNDINTGAARTIAANGTTLGMRNGYFSTEVPITPAINDYTTAANDSVAVVPLDFAKNVVDPLTDPLINNIFTIGEHQRFSLVIDLPEGITNNLTLTDNLDNLGAAGESYVLEHDATYDILNTFSGIEFINNPGLDVEASFNAFPLNSGDAAVWDIGSVDTESENDPTSSLIDPQITIDYYARINNDTTTDSGDQLQNSATLSYDNINTPGVPTTITRTTAVITVVEPHLDVEKTVTNLTKPVPVSPAVPPDAGDVLQYTVRVFFDSAEPNQSSAFDINIQDNIPSGVTFDAGSASITIDGVGAGNLVPDTTGSVLVWGRTNTTAPTPLGDDALDLLYTTGTEELILTYTVTVNDDVQPADDLNGTVVVDWTSLQTVLPAVNPLERFGLGGAACDLVTDPKNDYCVSDDAPLAVPNPAVINKTADNDSFDDPAYSSANDGVLRIGDIVEYTLRFNLIEGDTFNIVLDDTLDAGLSFVGIVSINGDAGTGTIPNRSYNDAAATTGSFSYDGGVILESSISELANVITFNLGNITSASNNITTDDEFVIVYQAQVVQGVLAHTPSLALSNTVNLNHDNQATTPQSSSTESISALQPQILLTDITKERFDSFYTTSIPSGSSAASGIEVFFRLSACNSGDAPAYDVVLVDDLNPVAGTSLPQLPVLASEFDLASVSVPVVRVNGAVLAPVNYTYTLVGGIMTFDFDDVALNPLANNPDNCIEIDYSVFVDASLASNNSWDNSYQVNSYASLDPGNVDATIENPPVPIVNERQVYAGVGPVLYNLQNLDPFIDPSKSFVSVTRPDSVGTLTVRDARYAAVGELVTYQIVTPETGMNGALNQVVINDTLNNALTFSSANLIFNAADPLTFGQDANETIDTVGSVGTTARVNLRNLNTSIGTLPGLHTATVDLVARVDNNVNANSGVAFGNSAIYQFTNSSSPSFSGPGSTLPANNVNIIEPQLDLSAGNQPTITVTNITKPLPAVDAGDVLEYTITYGFLGGAAADLFSDAYDISITSDIGAGLTYLPGFAQSVVTPPVGPVVTLNDASLTPDVTGNIVTWSILADPNTDIDVPENGTATFTYRVTVSDAVLAAETLTNSSVIRWTSLDDDINNVDEANERDGSGGINDYFSSDLVSQVDISDTNTFNKAYLTDTSPQLNLLNVPSDVRIGDLVQYTVTLNLQEGNNANVRLQDTLPVGMVFAEVVSINGDTTADYTSPGNPFSYTAIPAINTPTAGQTVLNWNLGDITNRGSVGDPDGNNIFEIVYLARVTDDGQPAVNSNPVSGLGLQNFILFNYDIDGPGIGIDPVTQTQNDDETIVLQHPNLSVAKTSTQQFANPALTIIANEIVTYTVTITNNGASPAYDVLLHDTLPIGLRPANVAGITVNSILVNGVAVTNLAPLSYNPATGFIVWDFDNGDPAYSIPADSGTLVLEYAVAADANIGAGLTGLQNTAHAEFYYSFDDDVVPTTGVTTGVREIYGPSNIALSIPALGTPAPSPLVKANLNSADLNRSIGVPFTYRITVPETPLGTALYDVRILDNLGSMVDSVGNAVVVDVILDSVQKPVVAPVPPLFTVSNSGSWIPVNTGLNAVDLVIEDPLLGIDIPEGEQIIVDITVLLRNNNLDNVDGKTFVNSASYTYNSIDNDPSTQLPGGSDSDLFLTIVEPTAMTLQKTAPALIAFGTPGRFTIDVQNIGTGSAFDMTITDVLPNPLFGGMCNPLTPPTVFSAGIFLADGVTLVGGALVENTHFTTNFIPPTITDPTICTFTITMTAPETEIAPSNRLIVTYDAELDEDNVNNSTLDNIAASTQWFSADTPLGVVAGEIREYNELLTDGTPANALDHEDVATTTVESPDLVIEKEVFNTITGANAFTAEPGDSVRYEITIRNDGPVPANNFSLTDEVDRLNGAGLFVPGSMSNINVSQAGADTSNTDINAGTNSAGILDVRNMTLSELTGGDNTLLIDFEVTLQGVIDSGVLVRNQADVSLLGFSSLLSDDPDLPGALDPTQTIIGSIPTFRLLKTSEDITGSATTLQAGDILRYTITAQNIGAENAINTLLRDQVPANTSYVANSTRLNGVAMLDATAGISPLQDGILINALEDLTPGAMRADSTATTNIASIQFDVLVNENVVNSTVISNQAFVGGDGVGSGAFSEQPSDDPDTEIIGDPTRDVVGNVAIIDAQKIVELVVDNNNVGEVDPGDTLRYTITIDNSGTIPATEVVLIDAVPTDTTYVLNSTTLNGEAIADVAGTLPTVGGLPVSSADLTPPIPTTGNGIVNPQQSAIIVFDVTVNAIGVVDGDIISNQGLVTSAEFPEEQTDADGNDLNGDQPTDIIVGSTQQLRISKDVFVVGGGTAQPGAILEYFITVENVGPSAIDVGAGDTLKLFDNINQSNLITYVPNSARLNGVADPINIVFTAPRLIVNYDQAKLATSPNFMFESGDKFTLRYLAQIDSAAAQGLFINNTVAVDWGVVAFPPASVIPPVNTIVPINCSGAAQNVDACSTVGLAVGGAPGVATLSGSIWHDANFDVNQDAEERVIAGWEVEVYFGAGSINPGDYLDSVFTDVNGNYNVLGLVPNDGDALKYALRFRPPGASNNTASLGTAISPFFGGNGPQTVELFELTQSSHIPDISLPIQPNGVAYDSVLRTPVVNAGLQLVNASGTILPASCFVDPAQQNQITTRDGYYKFELNFSQAECAAGAEYTINIFPPAGYFDSDSNPATPNVSQIIPPVSPLTDPGFDAVSCANDPLPTTQCEVQTSEFAPPTTIAPRTTGTEYYQKFIFNNGVGDDQIFNNHIALDPELDDAISISKTSALVNVTRGQLVPYTITLNNTLPAPLYDLDVVDLFPFGFKYINGSGRIQKGTGGYVKVEPVYAQGTVDENNVNRVPESTVNEEIDVSQIVGIETTQDYSNEARILTWGNIGTIDANSTVNIKLLLVVGSGVGEGEYVNRAVARNNQTTGATSLVAQATVRVVPDPTFDCSDVIGKIFDDKNLNAYQDEGEEGIPGVRVLTAKGLEITADSHGRFHLTCAVIPNPDRGSNFIIKLDERSLPSGYRLTTENPRVVRATRGKMVKFNFGAAIHRVVRLDMADAVFEENSTEMRPQWLPRLDLLMTELAKDPSLLRLSYLAENESESEVNDRLDAVKDEIEKRWEDLNCCYQLMIETEVFWRKGGPVGGEFDE